MDRRLTMRGVDRDYVLLVDFNAECRVEAVTGLTYPVVSDAMRAGNRSVIRHWVHTVLIDPPNQTLEQVGAIIDDIGGVEIFQASAGKARKGKRGRRR